MRRIIILLFMLVFITPVPAVADELVLEKGKGIEVCEAYQKSLQGMSLQDMVCGEKADTIYDDVLPPLRMPLCCEEGISNSTKDFKRPKWERLDLRENKELLRKIIKLFAMGDQFAEMEIMDLDDNAFKEFAKRTGLRYNPTYTMDALYKTSADIDNDGKAEKILLYQDAICMYTHVYSRPLFVLDEAKKQIDLKKTEPLMQNPFGKDLKSKAQDHLYQLYQIFFYKSKAYFDKWNMRDKTLSVYKQSKGEVKEICKYQYEQNSKNKEEEGHEN